MAAGDEVDRHHVGDQRDVGIGARRPFRAPAAPPSRWRRRHGRCGGGCARPRASGAAVAVAVGVERHAELGQPRDRRRRLVDDNSTVARSLSPAPAIIVSWIWALEAVACLEHRGDPALRPAGRAFVEPPLASTATLKRCGEVERRGQPGRARADDRGRRMAAALVMPPSRRRVRLRNTSSRSGSRVDTSTMPSPSVCSAASTSPAFTWSLR